MIYSNINTYKPVETPCILHYIGGTRYMLDTEHTFTMVEYPDVLIDDETGVVYSCIECINGTDIIRVIEA